MNSSTPSPVVAQEAPRATPPVIPTARRFNTAYVVLIIAVLLLCLTARAVAGYFMLGNETVAMRKAVAARIGGQYQKKFAVRLGWITTALVRYGTRFVNLPPEPRAALDTLRRVEVGVYKLPAAQMPCPGAEILAETDRTMTKRGWDRIVGVVHEDQTVAIYVPHKGVSRSNIECALLVLNHHDLVIASGAGNPLPLIELASKKIEEKRNR